MNIVIIDYGAGNMQSVLFAIERLGFKAIPTADPELIKAADKVIFPGVGNAQAAMDELKKRNLDTLIPTLTQPILGVCLGMQLLCESSEEGNVPCLGILPTKVIRFTQSPKIPHMGWNTAYNLKSNLMKGITEEDHVYYVHSYYVPVHEFTVATSKYGEEFTGAIHKDNFYGTQFHPEKSGGVGEKIVQNFLEL